MRFHADYHADTTTVRGYRTDANFDAFVVSRRSDVQDIGVAENLFENFGSRSPSILLPKNKLSVINVKRETVPVVNPFTGAV